MAARTKPRLPKPRLREEDVAAWLVKSTVLPDALAEGWTPGATRVIDRCLRRSYRLGLVRVGQPCVLWVSGRDHPGVHAVGTVAGLPTDDEGRPEVRVALRRLARPVPRSDLLASPAFREAEVVRMPAGSNPSYLTVAQLAAVRERVTFG